MLAKQPASLGGFEFDAIIKRSETMTSDVPEYATEEGYSITDNICLGATRICWMESMRPHLLCLSTAMRRATLQAGICRLNAAALVRAPLLMRVVLLAPCETPAEPLRERSILQMAQRTMSGLREMRILSR